MSEIDSNIIKRTQETLGKYVKKPVLSEKLLKKPPFRFLHDIFNAVIRDTGYFAGLYTPEELNYENITDRDAKMKFLQKMIDAIKIITKETLTVRPSKIVAGHEPENTNELLQLMGLVIENKLEWKPAIAQISGSPSKQKTKDKESKEKKSTDRSRKVAAATKTEAPKEKPKTDVKEKSKSKDVKEKPLRKQSKTSPEKNAGTKLSSKSPSTETLKSTSRRKMESPHKVDQNDKEDSPEHIIEEASMETVKNTIRRKMESPQKIDPKLNEDDTPIATKKEQPKEALRMPEKVKTVNLNASVNSRESAAAAEPKVASPPEPNSPSTDFKRDEHRASKRAQEILLSAAAEDNNDGSSSRRSSGRSRRSSAEKPRKSKPDESSAQISSDFNDPLKTVAEEPLPEVISSPSLNSQPSPTTNKRETTFVRVDSKESSQPPARPRTSLRPPSARPASARPGAPRRRDKNIEIVLQPNDQIKLSGISVKLETFNSELEDDGENLVIIENPNTEDQLQETLSKDHNSNQDDSLNQGHLVQQILETQKELVQGSTQDNEQKRDKENDISKLNSRISSARQMNSLRDVIQNLTKSVNPLGKLMDFIPEDIDAMQLELTMWRDTYNQSSIELKKERSLTESVTEPMKNQLVTIEANIKEYRDMIDACRAKILQNAEKIHRLLTTQ